MAMEFGAKCSTLKMFAEPIVHRYISIQLFVCLLGEKFLEEKY